MPKPIHIPEDTLSLDFISYVWFDKVSSFGALESDAATMLRKILSSRRSRDEGSVVRGNVAVMLRGIIRALNCRRQADISLDDLVKLVYALVTGHEINSDWRMGYEFYRAWSSKIEKYLLSRIKKATESLIIPSPAANE
jgi:hypothetical protein